MTLEDQLKNRFIAFRKKHIGSQYDAAEVCECSQKNISEIESGKTSISLNTAYMLYKKKKMSTEWFFDGKGSDLRTSEPKESLLTNISELKGEIEVMKKYIETMQKSMKKLIIDFYAIK
ncbi:helix-turn-helix domain-containing protein [Pedobacter jejuensis]|uniref:XRE family transcriptional regulator n=1 Tax=Pedobacter jejuensis TaxID=1268550 RepID=A0A3N0BVS6_9SPHI|nr:helix-turn-helix transcriptional regulator [Pedobacter jejuensis]RNL53767.1 XRE family transcriptional regulator [Pedobacter jejuensis]